MSMLSTPSDLPLISIVVISFRHEATVCATLASCAAQSYPHIELICCDDASPDQSVARIRDWISQHSSRFQRCQLIAQPENRGTVENLNAGLRAASGKYIKIIAADDLLLPHCLSDLLAAYQEAQEAPGNPKTLFLGSGLTCDAQGNVLQEIRLPAWYFQLEAQEQLALYALFFYFVFTPGILYPREVFEQEGLFQPEHPLIEDLPYYMHLLAAGYRFRLIETPVALYRVHAQSISQSGASPAFLRSLEAFLQGRFPQLLQRAGLQQYLAYFQKRQRLSQAKGRLSSLRARLSLLRAPLYWKQRALEKKYGIQPYKTAFWVPLSSPERVLHYFPEASHVYFPS
ncbi:MAG: glycosyltransferase family 2 protein [Nitritalea sp.]